MADMKNKRWKDLRPRQRRGITVLSIVELVFTALALWDLAHRPASKINGKKPVWVMLSFVQPVGPIAYLLFGRKK